MLYTMDGNDSLKQIIRWSAPQDKDSSTPGPSSGLPSNQKVCGDRYLPRESVDKWAKDILQEMMGDVGDGQISKLHFLIVTAWCSPLSNTGLQSMCK
jgi:hypothetical protein